MKPAGERLPITAMLAAAAMLGVYLTTTVPPTLGAAEILRDGPSPAAPYQKPDVEDLLAGRACVPMSYLLSNRSQESIHSYSRDVNCQGGTR